MRSDHIQYGGGLESLRLREDPVPEQGPTEVLVRLRANSLSARELDILRRHHRRGPARPGFDPAAPGFDPAAPGFDQA